VLQQFVAALLIRRMPREEFDEAVKAQFDRDLDRRASDGPRYARHASSVANRASNSTRVRG